MAEGLGRRSEMGEGCPQGSARVKRRLRPKDSGKPDEKERRAAK